MPGRFWERVKSYTPFDVGVNDPLVAAEDEAFAEDTYEEEPTSEIVFRRPITLEQAEDAAQYLKQRRALIVNLERADQFEAQRIIDFLSGVCFAMDGFTERIGNGIYLFTPPDQRINVEERAFISSGGILLRDEGSD